MTNVVILPGYVYIAILFVLMILSLSMILIGVVLRKILYYIQMLGLDVCEVKMVARTSEESILDKLDKNNHSDTTRLIYIKGQLDRVLNNLSVNRGKYKK